MMKEYSVKYLDKQNKTHNVVVTANNARDALNLALELYSNAYQVIKVLPK